MRILSSFPQAFVLGPLILELKGSGWFGARGLFVQVDRERARHTCIVKNSARGRIWDHSTVTEFTTWPIATRESSGIEHEVPTSLEERQTDLSFFRS